MSSRLSDLAFLSSKADYSTFTYGGRSIRFATPYTLRRYLRVKKYHDGYLEVDADYGDDECELSIPEGEVLSGSLPPRQLRNVQTFIDLRESELRLNWDLCMQGQNVIWIDPIR